MTKINTRLWLGAAITLVLVFQFFWSAHGTWRLPGNQGELRLLELQVEAFQRGQLALAVEPHPELLRSPNPYDPVHNRATRLLDAALYDGRYYTYFGPAPLVLFLWPYYALTGEHMSGAFLGWVLGAGAFLFQAGALRSVARRWYPDVSGHVLALVVVSAGLTNLLPLLLVSHETFDLPILAGLFFSSAGYAALAGVVDPGASRLRWATVSLCFGLAMASRVVLIPAHLLTLGIAMVWALRTDGCRPGTWIAFAASPVATCLGLLAVYNSLRFGSPFDFGNKYTLVEMDWTKTPAFSWRYFPANLYYYWFSVPRLGRWFPYVIESGGIPFAPPAGYLAGYVDRVSGFWTTYPLLAIGGCTAGYLLLRSRLPTSLRGLFVAWGTGALVLGLVLTLFVGSSARYQVELAGTLVLPVGVAGLWVYSTVWQRRRAAVVIWTSVAVYSATACCLVAFTGHRGLATANPAVTMQLRAFFDRVAFPLQNALGAGVRKAVLDVTFPADKVGKVEPLWVHGRPAEADFLYLFYATDQSIQFGFESMGRGGPKSSLVPVDYSVAHKLEILAAPFLPPPGHPFHSRVGAHAAEKRMLLVKLDSTSVFWAVVEFHAGGDRHYWGESPDEPAFGTQFTGRLRVSWERMTDGEMQEWAKRVSP